MGKEGPQENGYTAFNVLRSPKYQHEVREKGDRELIVVHGVPYILRKAYKEMEETKPIGGVRRVRPLDNASRFNEFPLYEYTWSDFQM